MKAGGSEELASRVRSKPPAHAGGIDIGLVAAAESGGDIPLRSHLIVEASVPGPFVLIADVGVGGAGMNREAAPFRAEVRADEPAGVTVAVTPCDRRPNIVVRG